MTSAWSNMFFWLRSRVRAAIVTVVLLAGIGLFGGVAHSHYPIQKWLFWHYAGYWLAIVTLSIVCYGIGHIVLKRVVRASLPIFEHAILSFSLGVFSYEIIMFFVGVLQGYRAPVFFALPIVLLAVVARPLWRHGAYVRRLFVRQARTRPRLGPAALALAFGCIGLGMVYFLILTPQNIQFDARWKHMALAEEYVVHRGVHRAVEGWVFSARPHFTSYLYAWAFLLPGGRLFDRMLLSAHIEYIVFLFTTVVGIPALVRRLVPRIDPRWIWAARFLFPGVLLYDSSLSGGADHVGAMYCVPIALCLLRVLRDLDLRFAALLGIYLAAASLTKETVAIMLVPMPLLLVGIRALIAALSAARGRLDHAERRRFYLAPLLLVGMGLIASAPLWFKNFIFYGDPLYPLLHRYLRSRPWTDQAAYRFLYGYWEGKMWAPSRDWAGLLATLKAMFTYSFVPNDWSNFHRNVPVFGSLFTLLLASLLFLRKTKRIWLIVLWVHVAIFTWYSVHHQDRYLQGILPLMAAVTAAIAVLVWRSFGVIARSALAALVGLQIIWGGDVYFIQTHALVKSPIKEVVNLISAGQEGKYEERFAIQSSYQDIGASLPRGSKLLVHLFHEHHAHLGTGVETVLDSYLWQFGIEYGAAGTPEGVRKMLRALGVSHVFLSPDKKSDGIDSLASDILFWEFMNRHLVDRKSIAGGVLGRIPDNPIADPPSNTVAILSCAAGGPPKGLFRLNELRTLPYGPKMREFPKPLVPAATQEEAEALIPMASYAILELGCYKNQKPTKITQSFDLLVERRGHNGWRTFEIYARRGAPPQPLP